MSDDHPTRPNVSDPELLDIVAAAFRNAGPDPEEARIRGEADTLVMGALAACIRSEPEHLVSQLQALAEVDPFGSVAMLHAAERLTNVVLDGVPAGGLRDHCVVGTPPIPPGLEGKDAEQWTIGASAVRDILTGSAIGDLKRKGLGCRALRGPDEQALSVISILVRMAAARIARFDEWLSEADNALYDWRETHPDQEGQTSA